MSERKHIEKKMLFCGFWQKHQQAALTEHLEKFSYEKVGLVSHHNYLEELMGDKDIFISQKAIYRHNTFKGNPHDQLPPKDIVELMQPVETTCLKMMDRNYKHPIKYRRYDFRKRTYLAQLASAYAVLKAHDFDQILYSTLPHNTFDYILHHLAQHMGKRSSFFAQIQVKDSFFHADDIERIYDQIVPALDDSEELPEHMEIEISDRQGITKPFYMSAAGLSWKQRIYRKQKQVFRIHSYIQPFYALPNKLAYRKIPKLMEPPKRDYVYFAMHFQPEATTCPLGGVYVDQYFAILMLARSLPEDVTVMVKEHPGQHFWQRFPEFYKVLQAEKNIAFADITTDSLKLTKNSLAVATITGTVGWEAIFNKKPVFLFGNIFYKHLKGVVNVTDQDSILNVVNAIRDGSHEFAELSDIRKLLRAIHRVGYTGVMDEEYFRNSAFSKEHTHQVILDALEEITT